MRYLILLGLAIMVSACSMEKDTALAEAQVARFHQELNSQQFETMYENAGPELKAAGTKSDFVALLNAVHRKLGTVTSSKRVTWNVNYHTSGSFVTLGYETTFTNGKGAEQFVYKLDDGKAFLVGYHINSNELVTN